jgi:hypothetical protein
LSKSVVRAVVLLGWGIAPLVVMFLKSSEGDQVSSVPQEVAYKL